MYEQGYADFCNLKNPQEDNSEYNIGWADAEAEYARAEYSAGQDDYAQDLEADTNRSQAYYDGYNSAGEYSVQRSTLA